MVKNISTKWDQNQAGVVNLISDKIDFKPKLIRTNKVGHFILINGTVKEKHITPINLNAPNSGAHNFAKMHS